MRPAEKFINETGTMTKAKTSSSNLEATSQSNCSSSVKNITPSQQSDAPPSRPSMDPTHADGEWYYGPFPAKTNTTTDAMSLSTRPFGGDIHAELRKAKAERARLQDRIDVQDNYIVALQAALEAKRVGSKMSKSQCPLMPSVGPSK